MKTAQELADRLAELAGWALTDDGYWAQNGDTMYGTDHPFAVGSLDALEAFRREQLAGCILSYLHDYSDQGGEVDPRFCCEASIVRLTDGEPDGCWIRSGRTMWYAYAAALAAAKETK